MSKEQNEHILPQQTSEQPSRETALDLPENLHHPKYNAPATGDTGDFSTESHKVEELLNHEPQFEVMNSFIELMSS